MKLIVGLLMISFLSIPLFVDAGIVWKCEVSGKVLSRPKLIENESFQVLFKAVRIQKKDSDFCGDRIGKIEEIILTKEYYKKLGSPKNGSQVTLQEYKEENDFGYGLTQWRYFDFGLGD